MSNFRFPQVNDKMYLINKEVIVIKVIETFHLLIFKYIDSSTKYIVDISSLRYSPDKNCSISINILGGVK